MLQEQVSETENFHEDSVGAEPIGPTQDAVVQDRSSTSVDEASGEPQKHTYASIVCFFSYYGSSVASMMLIFFLVLVVNSSYVLQKDNLHRLLLFLARMYILLLLQSRISLLRSLQTSNDLHRQTHMKGLD